jgi:hypothetical protein
MAASGINTNDAGRGGLLEVIGRTGSKNLQEMSRAIVEMRGSYERSAGEC